MLQRLLGHSLDEFVALEPARRAELALERVADLHALLPPVPDQRAERLAERLGAALARDGAADPDLRARIVTDALLREECSHDQNVYLGRFFTRTLTRAVPDLVFQPRTPEEVVAALHWARKERLPLTTRGAASTALGGAVPSDGGLLLDTARLDHIEVDAARRSVRFGAGARMRPLHARLSEHGLALPVYPSNLGGTYAGWLATGGIGLNAYGRGRALDALLAAEVVLAGGEHVRLDRAGGLLLLQDGAAHAPPRSREDWFRSKGYRPLALADLAGSEGQFGLIVRLEVELEPRGELASFLLSFARVEQAHAALDWIAGAGADGLSAPAGLKLLSGSYLRRAESVWAEEDRKAWRALPSAYGDGAGLPWTRLLAPSEVGARPAQEPARAAAFVCVDFLGAAGGRAFAARLAECPGAPGLADARSLRFARERFRPQQVKRLGPGLLAAEILLPAGRVAAFLPAAERLAAGAGVELDTEVSFLADGQALVVAGFAADHRKGSFHLALMLVPALLDLAARRFEGRAYVIGRWQAPLLEAKLGAEEARRLRELKRALDPGRCLNRGAFFELGLRTPLARVVAVLLARAGWIFRALFGCKPLASCARWLLDRCDGPAAGRRPASGKRPSLPDPPAAAGACVNCGECNSVCPVFHESAIRLPQMLTHAGQRQHGGEAPSRTSSALLDLCVRCGGCEQVCQAGIPHLPLYQVMQAAAESALPGEPRRERQVLVLERLRASERYTRGFLGLRGQAEPSPAALGTARFVLLRAENEAGPGATCVHCRACVDVCPTGANQEYAGPDPRRITTVQERCIGCGACVEVCPANRANDGQTLRVTEADSRHGPSPAPGSS